MEKTDAKPITRAEMIAELERLKDHKVQDRFTVSDLAFLTGWTPTYLRRLEQKRVIPASKRRGEPRMGVISGLRKRGLLRRGADGELPKNFGRERFWEEEEVRLILGIRRSKKGKSPWLYEP